MYAEALRVAKTNKLDMRVFANKNGELLESRILGNIINMIFHVIPDLSRELDKSRIIAALNAFTDCNLFANNTHYPHYSRPSEQHLQESIDRKRMTNTANYEAMIRYAAVRFGIAADAFVKFIRAMFAANEFTGLYPNIEHALERLSAYFAIADRLSNKSLATIIVSYCTSANTQNHSILEQFKIFAEIARKCHGISQCEYFIIEGCVGVATAQSDPDAQLSLIHADEFSDYLADLDPIRYAKFHTEIVQVLGSAATPFPRNCMAIAKHIKLRELFIDIMKTRNAMVTAGLLKSARMIEDSTPINSAFARVSPRLPSLVLRYDDAKTTLGSGISEEDAARQEPAPRKSARNQPSNCAFVAGE